MTRDELLHLRREAATALRRLQALEGFSARRDEIEPPPESVRHWPWTALVSVIDRNAPCVTIWVWLPAEQLDGALIWQAARIPRHRRTRGGRMECRVPIGEVAPTEPWTLDAIDRYRGEVERFATGFLVSKAWAYEVVHRALRDGSPLRLSPLPRGPYVEAPARLVLDVKEGEQVPYDIIPVMQQFADLTCDKPKVDRSLRSAERRKTWDGWLGAMEKRLNSEKTTSTDRARINEARRYLDACATGVIPRAR